MFILTLMLTILGIYIVKLMISTIILMSLFSQFYLLAFYIVHMGRYVPFFFQKKLTKHFDGLK